MTNKYIYFWQDFSVKKGNTQVVSIKKKKPEIYQGT